MTSQTDTDLVRAFRKGDREAFAELIRRHRGRVLHLATAVLARDAANAEDVVQEASYQAYFEIARLRQPDRFGAWLCGIAVNLAKMQLRHNRHALSLDELTGGRYVPEALVQATTTPEQAYEALDLQERVQAALNVLPADMRAAVWLHYVEGMAYQEIGAITGIAPGTLRVLSHRARQQLRQELAGEWQPRRYKRKQKMIEVNVHDVEVRVPKDRSPDRRFLIGTWTVLLKSKADMRMMRMWVGPAEGQSIAQYLTGGQTSRPQTYEFIDRLLEGVGSEVERVEVTELVDDTFIASVHVRSGNHSFQIDARPSDAINVALRSQAPIFWAEDIVERVGFMPGGDGPEGLEWWQRPGAQLTPRRAMMGVPYLAADDSSEWITGSEMLKEMEQRQSAFFERLQAKNPPRT